MEARVIQVIETSLVRRGVGTSEDPTRIIRQYWSLDGKLLAEVDPFIKHEARSVNRPSEGRIKEPGEVT